MMYGRILPFKFTYKLLQASVAFACHCEQILQKFAYAFCLQGQNAFVSLFDGTNLRYKILRKAKILKNLVNFMQNLTSFVIIMLFLNKFSF